MICIIQVSDTLRKLPILKATNTPLANNGTKTQDHKPARVGFSPLTVDPGLVWFPMVCFFFVCSHFLAICLYFFITAENIRSEIYIFPIFFEKKHKRLRVRATGLSWISCRCICFFDFVVVAPAPVYKTTTQLPKLPTPPMVQHALPGLCLKSTLTKNCLFSDI